MVGLFCLFPRSELSLLSHIIAWAALDKARYSASAVDSATVSWFLLRHDTGPPAIRKRYPEVDFLSSLFPVLGLSPSKVICFTVPFRYLNICFRAIQWLLFALLKNLARVVTANAMSGLMHVARYKDYQQLIITTADPMLTPRHFLSWGNYWDLQEF